VALWVTVFMIAAIFGKQLTINCLRDAITYFDLNQQSSSIRRMYVAVPQMSAGEVLSAFHRDAPASFWVPPSLRSVSYPPLLLSSGASTIYC
jgi:hypothetical protein